MAEDCINDEGMLQALKAFQQASKIGELLLELRAVTFRLNSGKRASSSVTACPAWRHADGDAKALPSAISHVGNHAFISLHFSDSCHHQGVPFLPDIQKSC